MASSSNVPYTFEIANQSGLDQSSYTLRVLGFSVASGLILLADGDSSLSWQSLPAGATLSVGIQQGSSAITIKGGLPAFMDILLGDQVAGDGIPEGTTVTGISVNVTLSLPLSNAVSGTVDVVSQLMVGGTATDGSDTITALAPPPSVGNLRIGQVVAGSGVPSGATVSRIGPGAQVVLTQAADANATYTNANPLTFSLQVQGNGAASQTSLTLSGVASAALIGTGVAINANGIISGTIISSISSVEITLSAPANATNSSASLTFIQAQNGAITAGSTTVSGLASTAAFGVGFPVQGDGIPSGAAIAEIVSTTSVALSSAATTTATEALTFPRATGVVPSFDISQFSQFVFNPNQQTAGLNGARVYLFVVPDNWPAVATQSGFAGYPTNPPGFPYSSSATGFGIQQPNTPPNIPNTNSSYPPFSIVEPTIDSQDAGGRLHIDVQTVDGFTFPLTLGLADVNGDSLGQVGQPLPAQGVERAAIIAAFQSAFPTGNPYAPLLYGGPNDIDNQYPGILNPGAFLASNENSGSPLATLWNSALTTLYTSSNTLLNMIGDDSDYYQGTPRTVTQGGNTYNVLQFIGYTDEGMTQQNGNEFNLYSPQTPDPPNAGMGAGFQVFANAGVFADSSSYVIVAQNQNQSPTPASVALGLQRDIVSALNRGIALLVPSETSNRSAGDTSLYWGTEGNWYPAAMSDSTAPQNQFSLFMHTAMVSNILIFTAPGAAPVAIESSPAGATVSGVTVTITTSAPHGLAANDWVAIQDVACAGYNGYFQVATTPSTTTFTYLVDSSVAATLTPSGGGTATAGAAVTPQGALMGQAYGFAYDESPVHAGANQPNVPSKYDPAPAGTTTVTISFGPWNSSS